MAKIGILGGTFNPIHLGHIKLAQSAYDELHLDTVWFMPSKNPPHKDNSFILSEKHRLSMLQLAIQEYTHFQISDIELKRQETTYTSYTLEYLKSLALSNIDYADNEYYFIVGADSIYNIESWNRPEVLFKLADFVVSCRDDVDYKMLHKQCDYLHNKYNARISIIHMDKINISSSYIRKHYKNGIFDDYADFVPKNVHDYIIVNKLYFTEM